MKTFSCFFSSLALMAIESFNDRCHDILRGFFISFKIKEATADAM